MGLRLVGGSGGSTGEQTKPVFEAAIFSDAHRIALNGITKERIAEARINNERLRFSSRGVDAFGSTKRFLKNKKRYGKNDPRTKAAERVFDFDIMTGLFEETEEVFSFSVSYPVEDGKVLMGELAWDELAANGALDEEADSWYLGRSFVEAREAVLVGQYVNDGLLEDHDIVTISNTATAKNADKYFSGEDLMIRHISFDKKDGSVHINQLMMHHLDNSVIQKLFQTLKVPVDSRTILNTDDGSTKYLATQIKVEKGELTNGAADIGFLLDYIASEITGKQHLFGKLVDVVEGDPYAEIFKKSREKEHRRKSAIAALKLGFCEMVKSGQENQETMRELFEDARSMVADIEGESFVEERYGRLAAQRFREKQKAIEEGDWGGASNAERGMQSAMGDVVICNTVMSSSANKSDSSQDKVCVELPKPGDRAKCPCCRKKVIVAGSVGKIACPTSGCKLEDRKMRKQRIEKERKAKLKAKKANEKKLSNKKPNMRK